MSKKVVRVHFMDDSSKAFAIEETATVQKLKSTVVEKIGLKEEESFALFEKKDGWERCLEHDEKPCELMSLWNVDSKKKDTVKDSLKEAAFAFIFKKKVFLRDDDKELKDTVARHLVYIQALYGVNESIYPCSVEDAIRLGGLQVQIVYGDHTKAHSVGFLSKNIKRFVPKDLYKEKKASEWENLILKAHQSNANKSADDAKFEYLSIVKQWPFYGTTFFPPCKTVGNKKLPSKIIIGVNAEGILLLKKDKEFISTHPFTDICSWSSSQTAFAFEFGTQQEPQKYSFETRQGAIIASTIQTYIDILVQILKSGEDEDDEEN